MAKYDKKGQKGQNEMSKREGSTRRELGSIKR
jgi:hypothetical protein